MSAGRPIAQVMTKRSPTVYLPGGAGAGVAVVPLQDVSEKAAGGIGKGQPLAQVPLNDVALDQRSNAAAYAGSIALHGQSRDVGGGVATGEDARAAESGDDAVNNRHIS